MAEQEPTISTHVLDVERGRPASGVTVSLYRVEGSGERLVGGGMTDDDGRIRRLLDDRLVAGAYRLEFVVGGDFFRELSVGFTVMDTARSYHVPLIMAPYSLSTYRGS
jgi:5-hydroxyisourate hydrolase